MINYFSGEYEFLSNFYMTPVLYEGLWYPSSEHAYQAAKTIILKERMMILNCRTPGQAKRMGSKKSKKITLRPGWDSIRFDIMLEIVISKFKNEELVKKLISTKNKKLIEGNYWHDNYWGWCDCLDCGNRTKSNNLGFILTIARSRLNSELINKERDNNESIICN